MGHDARQTQHRLLRRALPAVLAGCLAGATLLAACVDYPAYDSEAYDSRGAVYSQPEVAIPEPLQLDQLVAPIALYPDPLVAQILAASTYPAQIVEEQRWMLQNSTLTGDALAQAVDLRPWDPSVKSLTQFPVVLAMMDKNLSWTSSLGEAYLSNPQAVMDAVQRLRHRAEAAGNLKSTPQEKVTAADGSIEIAPAEPGVVYVPEYDPWLIYGEPLEVYPGWLGYPGLYFVGPGILFPAGIGVFAGIGWGWEFWHPDWRGHGIWYRGGPWRSGGPAFWGHHPGQGGAFGRPPGHTRPGGRPGAGGGYRSGPPGGISRGGMGSGAFSGQSHGGITGAFSYRGHASFGGGLHSGGGGARGGGSRGGGGRH